MADKTHQDLINRISKNTKRLRIARKLTQEDMRDMGFNVRHYQRIETGDSAINTRTLARLADAFDVDAVEFLKVVKKA